MRVLRDPVTVTADERQQTCHWAQPGKALSFADQALLQPGDLPVMIVQDEESGSRGIDRTEGRCFVDNVRQAEGFLEIPITGFCNGFLRVSYKPRTAVIRLAGLDLSKSGQMDTAVSGDSRDRVAKPRGVRGEATSYPWRSRNNSQKGGCYEDKEDDNNAGGDIICYDGRRKYDSVR